MGKLSTMPMILVIIVSRYICLLLIAASTLLTDIAFAQSSTITSLNTTDTAGTPTTVTVTGASAPSSFAGQALMLNYLGGDRTLSSYVTSAGTFEAV